MIWFISVGYDKRFIINREFKNAGEKTVVAYLDLLSQHSAQC
jgi:hypothetical protein